MEKQYTDGTITVVWKHELCIHSENCFHGLPRVFNPKQRPWVNIEAAERERIVAQVNKCPSGALSYFYNATGKALEEKTEVKLRAIIAAKQPAQVTLEIDKKYAWCACGRSEKQPFCDSSHKSTELKSLVFKPEKDDEVWLCQCKQTKNPPYCDGTHRTL